MGLELLGKKLHGRVKDITQALGPADSSLAHGHPHPFDQSSKSTFGGCLSAPNTQTLQGYGSVGDLTISVVQVISTDLLINYSGTHLDPQYGQAPPTALRSSCPVPDPSPLHPVSITGRHPAGYP